MDKELRWRVVYGYGSNEYISINEDYLEKAKYAMITGGVFSFKDQTIRGSEIKRIEPDVRYYTGWFDSYKPTTGEDFAQIERDVPSVRISDRSNLADKRINYIINNKQPELLQKINSVDNLLLGK